jgi:hypothetical protein
MIVNEFMSLDGVVHAVNEFEVEHRRRVALQSEFVGQKLRAPSPSQRPPVTQDDCLPPGKGDPDALGDHSTKDGVRDMSAPAMWPDSAVVKRVRLRQRQDSRRGRSLGARLPMQSLRRSSRTSGFAGCRSIMLGRRDGCRDGGVTSGDHRRRHPGQRLVLDPRSTRYDARVARRRPTIDGISRTWWRSSRFVDERQALTP